MKNYIVLTLIIFVVLGSLYGYSYKKFSGYRPNVEIESQKETKIENTYEDTIKLPFPEKYNLVSNNEGEDGQHITFETSQSPDLMQTFYRNILLSKNWVIESTGKENIFTTTTYKLGRAYVEVTTSQKQETEPKPEFNTMVSLVIKD